MKGLTVTIFVMSLVTLSEGTFNAILFTGISGTQLYTPIPSVTKSPYSREVVDVDFGLPKVEGATTVVMNNTLYIMGGADTRGNEKNTAFSFTPSTNKTTRLADMKRKRSHCISTALPKEGAIVVCGSKLSTESNSCDRYNVDLNEWSIIESMPLPDGKIYMNTGEAVTLLDSVYIFGGFGYNGNGTILDNVFKLGTDGNWTEMARMPVPLCGFGVVAMEEDTAMVCGGFTPYGHTPSCYWYSATTDTWTVGPSLTQSHILHKLVLYNGRVWCLGGWKNTVEVYDEYTGWHKPPINKDLNDDQNPKVAVFSTD